MKPRRALRRPTRPGYRLGVLAVCLLIGAVQPAAGSRPRAPDVLAFSNTDLITIQAVGAAAPYPSSISSGSCSGTITDVNASLHGFGHPSAYDVDVVLRGPTGQSTVLMSDAGAAGNVEDIDVFLDDEAGTGLPDSTTMTTGTFKPTDHDSAPGDFGSDTMPAPGPTPDTAALSVFDGTTPVGNWELFVADDTSGSGGDFEGGWRLRLEVTPCAGAVANVAVTGGKAKEGSKATFILSRIRNVDQAETVAYVTKKGSARPRKDFRPASGELAFAPGEASKVLTVKTRGDRRDERKETFILAVTSGGVTTEGTAKIRDDD